MSLQRVTTRYVLSLVPGLSERDRAILQTVQRLRLVRSTQLERLHFSGLSDRSRPRRRRDVLARLTSQRLLATLQRRIGGARSGSAGYVYALGPAGQRLAQLEAGEAHRLRSAPWEPSLHHVKHTLAVAEIYVNLHDCKTELVTVSTEPRCWRPIRGTTDILKPDLFAEVADDALIHSWFIEVDLGTERSPALQRKAGRYLDALNRGTNPALQPFPRVVWLTPDHARAQFVAEAVQRPRPPNGLFLVAPTPVGPDDLRRLLLTETPS